MPKLETQMEIGRSLRLYLRVTRIFDRCGITYELSKYLPRKDNLFSVGKIRYLKITDTYLIINLTGALEKFQYSMYYDSPYNAIVRLVDYHQENYGNGLPCINPRTGKRSFLVYENQKLVYRLK